MTLSLEEMKANRRKWVEALRSGEFKQGKNRLRNNDGSMCCLGVLSTVAGCEWTVEDGSHKADGKSLYAPKRAKEFVGLVTDSGKFGSGEHNVLAWMNDQLGRSFTEIADIIESEPPGLFIDSTPTGSAS